MHVCVQTTGLWFRQCKTVVFRRFSVLTRRSMSVAVHRRFGRPCVYAATACLATGGATDSVHRRSQRTIQLQQRRIRFQRWFGGGEGLFSSLFLRIFRAPPGCPGVERQFSEPSTTKSSSLSRAPAQLIRSRLWAYTPRSVNVLQKQQQPSCRSSSSSPSRTRA